LGPGASGHDRERRHERRDFLVVRVTAGDDA